jgi:hypothetical protein
VNVKSTARIAHADTVFGQHPEVARLWLWHRGKHGSQVKIAKKLGVHKSVICRDSNAVFRIPV